MSNSTWFKKAVILDCDPNGMAPALQAGLLEIFKDAMKSTSRTLAHEARFDTADFSSAKALGGAGFTITLRRLDPESRTEWVGTIARGNERIDDVVGRLEDYGNAA